MASRRLRGLFLMTLGQDAIAGAVFESWFRASPMISNCRSMVAFSRSSDSYSGEGPAAAEVFQQPAVRPTGILAGHAAYRFSRVRMTSSKKYGLRTAVIVTTSTGRSRICSRPSFNAK